MNRVAFLTTVFPMNISFLKEMLDSLVLQSFKSFDLIVVNDDLDEFDFIAKNYKGALNIVEIKGANSPAKNREIGINYCIDSGYEFLVFGDSDDRFAKNRISLSLEKLKSADIIVNDLTLFDSNGVLETGYLSNRVLNDQIIEFEFIKDKNIFGLTNTSVRLNNFSKVEFPIDLVAIDWYFFSLMLLEEKIAVFSNETISYYRQHNRNMVGFKSKSKDSREFIAKVKKLHYKALKAHTNKVDSECTKYLSDDVNVKRESKTKSPLWWELA